MQISTEFQNWILKWVYTFVLLIAIAKLPCVGQSVLSWATQQTIYFPTALPTRMSNQFSELNLLGGNVLSCFYSVFLQIIIIQLNSSLPNACLRLTGTQPCPSAPGTLLVCWGLVAHITSLEKGYRCLPSQLALQADAVPWMALTRPQPLKGIF